MNVRINITDGHEKDDFDTTKSF